MCLEVRGELHHRLVVSPLCGEQQPLGIQIVHDGDVVLPAAKARLVDAHELNVGEGFQRPSLLDVELDTPPQLLVRAAQQGCSLAHRQIQAQRQRQGLEGGREARARARPRHAHLRGLAAAAARHARHVAVQPGLELEEVQVPPGAAQPVVHGLGGHPASRTGQRLSLAADLEVDAALDGVELDVLHHPRRLQAQRAGEEGFYRDAHRLTPLTKTAPWTCGQAGKRPAHMPTGHYDQGSL